MENATVVSLVPARGATKQVYKCSLFLSVRALELSLIFNNSFNEFRFMHLKELHFFFFTTNLFSRINEVTNQYLRGACNDN